MKKKIFTILLCGIMVLGITGCRSLKNEFEVGNRSDVKISQGDVSMSIKEGTLKNTGATLILTNNSDKEFQYGNPYKIEIKQNGKWYKINVEINFTLPAFSLKSKESKEIELNWENGYGKLASGTYRIIKEINYEKEEGNFETFNVAVEFTIK
ncbi:MAG: immunoglobulin-like domain-containing protein [Bacilli bacterium]